MIAEIRCETPRQHDTTYYIVLLEYNNYIVVYYFIKFRFANAPFFLCIRLPPRVSSGNNYWTFIGPSRGEGCINIIYILLTYIHNIIYVINIILPSSRVKIML